MALKLAFSTVACPEWTLEQVVAKAAEFGYEGIELRTLGADSTVLASDPARLGVEKAAAILRDQPVKLVCLSTSLCLHHRDDTAAKHALRQVREQMAVAQALGAPALRVFGNEVEPGENRRSVISRIAHRAAELGHLAKEHGLKLLLENAGSFCVAKDWWTIFNVAEQSRLGLAWNVANAAAAGESPAVSVPLLHHRLGLAKVKDLLVGEGTGYVPLGEGNVGIEHFIHRLMGVGYAGYVSVEWDRAWLPTLAPAEEYLPQARQTLLDWMKEIDEARAAAKVKADKAAAKSGPQPRRRAS